DSGGAFLPGYTGRYFMELLDVLGLPPAPLVPSLPVSEDELAVADALLAERAPGTGPLVIVAPGAAFGPSKLWPADRFAAVANTLHEQGCCILISHGPDEVGTAEAVRAAAGKDYPGTDGVGLGVLKAVYARASLVL